MYWRNVCIDRPTCGRVQRIPERAAYFLVGALSILSLVFFLSGEQGQTAYAADNRNDWQYVAGDPCDGKKTAAKEKKDESSSTDTSQPDNGDWLTEGTVAYENCKRMFDILVDEFGFSGKAASGLIGALAYESGYSFDPLIAEMSNKGPQRFKDMNDREPPDGIAYYVFTGESSWTACYDGNLDKSKIVKETGYGKEGTGIAFDGGTGIFAFTPFEKYAYSSFWKDGENAVNTKEGWALENQVAYAVDVAIWQRAAEAFWPAGLFTGTKCEDFLTATDERQAEQAWYFGYERGANPDPWRMDDATKADKVFNTENKDADPSKWRFHTAGSDAPSISGDKESSERRSGNEDCPDVKEGKVQVGNQYINKIKEYAADSRIGYFYGGGHAGSYEDGSGGDLDCSGLISWAMIHSGVESLANMPVWFTGSADDVLTSVGFVRHDFEGTYDDIPPGSVMINPEHTELYIGKYDINNLDSDGNPTESENGVPLTIGAHSDYDGVDDDGHQKARGAENAWYGGGSDEVDGTTAAMNWVCYYTPDNVVGLEEGSGDSESVNYSKYGNDYKKASSKQKKVIAAANSVGATGTDMCAAWVSNVYAAAGVSTVPRGNACDMYFAWCNKPLSKLKPGMMIAVPTWNAGAEVSSPSRVYGHVGIYVGNGKVRHNVGMSVAEDPLEKWVATFGDIQKPKCGFPKGM